MTQEVETPPVVEDINTIKEEIKKLQTALEQRELELEQTKKGLSTAHQTLTQKDRQLKEQQDLRSDIASIRQAVIDQNSIIELQAAAIAMGREGDEEEIKRVNTLLHSKIAEQENSRKQAEAKRQQDQQTLANREYNQKADAIFAEAQTLFEGEDLKDIENLLLSNNLVLAQREVRLASKSKAPAPKVEPPKETDDARVTRLVKEQLIKDYPDLYKSDNNSPGGSITSPAEAMSQYAKGKITAEEAKKRGVNFD